MLKKLGKVGLWSMMIVMLFGVSYAIWRSAEVLQQHFGSAGWWTAMVAVVMMVVLTIMAIWEIIKITREPTPKITGVHHHGRRGEEW